MEIIDSYELDMIYTKRIKERLYALNGESPTNEEIRDIRIVVAYKALGYNGKGTEISTESMTKCLIALDEVLPEEN